MYTIVLNEQTVIELYGNEARAALIVPTRVKNEFFKEGEFKLRSDKGYILAIRLPIESYFNYHSRHQMNWRTAVIVKGKSSRYSQLELDWEGLGIPKILYAHYFPTIIPSYRNQTDSIVFYIPEMFIKDISIHQTKGKRCFEILNLTMQTKSSTKAYIIDGDFVSDKIEIMGSEQMDLCLHSGSEKIIIETEVKNYIAILKFTIILISGILFLQINRFAFKNSKFF